LVDGLQQLSPRRHRDARLNWTQQTHDPSETYSAGVVAGLRE
jgi:hypothetical protein